MVECSPRTNHCKLPPCSGKDVLTWCSGCWRYHQRCRILHTTCKRVDPLSWRKIRLHSHWLCLWQRGKNGEGSRVSASLAWDKVYCLWMLGSLHESCPEWGISTWHQGSFGGSTEILPESSQGRCSVEGKRRETTEATGWYKVLGSIISWFVLPNYLTL